MRWVRPILMMSQNSPDLRRERGLKALERGQQRLLSDSAAATWMAVGMTSLLDCPMFTWSFGCTGSREPMGLPAICEQRFAMTSFAFMFVLVPEPVWKMSTGKWASSTPAETSRGGLSNEIGAGGVKLAEILVGARGGDLDEAQGADELAREAVTADGEIEHGALGGCAIKSGDGDFHLAHGVFFDSCISHKAERICVRNRGRPAVSGWKLHHPLSVE